jgi:hypothetical protein
LEEGYPAFILTKCPLHQLPQPPCDEPGRKRDESGTTRDEAEPALAAKTIGARIILKLYDHRRFFKVERGS